MAEYIERGLLYELAYWHGEHPDISNPYGNGVDAVDISDIDRIPAADVAPVVRCKDCKFYREGKKLAPMKFCYRMNRLNRAPDDYCSKAERREDDADQR